MVKTDAWPDCRTECDVIGPRGGGQPCQRSSSIAHRGATILPPEGAAEDFVAGEPAGESDFQHGAGAAHQAARRLLQPQTLHEPFGSLYHGAAESAVELEPGSSRAPRQLLESDVPVEIPAHITQQVQESGVHCCFSLGAIVAPLLDLSCDLSGTETQWRKSHEAPTGRRGTA